MNWLIARIGYWREAVLVCLAVISLSGCGSLGPVDEHGNSIPENRLNQYALVVCGGQGTWGTVDSEGKNVTPGRRFFVCGLSGGQPLVHVFDVEAGSNYTIRNGDWQRYVDVGKRDDVTAIMMDKFMAVENRKNYSAHMQVIQGDVEKSLQNGSVLRFPPWDNGRSSDDDVRRSFVVTYLDKPLRAALEVEKRKEEEAAKKKEEERLTQKRKEEEVRKAEEEKRIAAEQQMKLAKQAEKEALLERQRQLQSGAIKTENMNDALLRYEGAGSLIARMARPLLKPDKEIYQGVVTLDAQESAGVLRAKNDPFNDPLLGYVMAEGNPFTNAMISTTGRDVFSFVKLKMTKQSVDFSEQSMSIGGRVLVFGKYVSNQKALTGQLIPVLEVLYIQGN